MVRPTSSQRPATAGYPERGRGPAKWLSRRCRWHLKTYADRADRRRTAKTPIPPAVRLPPERLSEVVRSGVNPIVKMRPSRPWWQVALRSAACHPTNLKNGLTLPSPRSRKRGTGGSVSRGGFDGQRRSRTTRSPSQAGNSPSARATRTRIIRSNGAISGVINLASCSRIASKQATQKRRYASTSVVRVASGFHRARRGEKHRARRPDTPDCLTRLSIIVHFWDLKSLAFRRPLPVRSRDGALPTDRPHPLRHQVPPRVDHQVPQEVAAGGRRPSGCGRSCGRSARSWRSRSSRGTSARTTSTCSSPARRTSRRAT